MTAGFRKFSPRFSSVNARGVPDINRPAGLCIHLGTARRALGSADNADLPEPPLQLRRGAHMGRERRDAFRQRRVARAIAGERPMRRG